MYLIKSFPHAVSYIQTSTHILRVVFITLNGTQTFSHFNLSHFLQINLYFTDIIEVLTQLLLDFSKGRLSLVRVRPTWTRTFFWDQKVSLEWPQRNKPVILQKPGRVSHDEKVTAEHWLWKMSPSDIKNERGPSTKGIHNFKEPNSWD